MSILFQLKITANLAASIEHLRSYDAADDAELKAAIKDTLQQLGEAQSRMKRLSVLMEKKLNAQKPKRRGRKRRPLASRHELPGAVPSA